MGDRNYQPGDYDAPPPNYEWIGIENYRRPRNEPAALPPNADMMLDERMAAPGSFIPYPDVNRADQALSWIGLLSSLAFSGTTLYIFIVTLLAFHRSVTLSHELHDSEGIVLFAGVMVSYILCLVALLRIQGRRGQRANRLRGWIGLILSVAAIAVLLLTYLGVV